MDVAKIQGMTLEEHQAEAARLKAIRQEYHVAVARICRATQELERELGVHEAEIRRRQYPPSRPTTSALGVYTEVPDTGGPRGIW